MDSYINQIQTSVPKHEAHQVFLSNLENIFDDPKIVRALKIFSKKSQIDRRYTVLNNLFADQNSFYPSEGPFPDTQKRMDIYQKEALSLVLKACEKLEEIQYSSITHLLVVSCTGFYAPGLDFDLVKHLGLSPKIKRSILGFMGCNAGISALRTADHIVQSDQNAKVLVVNLELCTLHLQKSNDINQVTPFLLFGDGCAVSIVSSLKSGLKLKEFHSQIIPQSEQLMSWNIGNHGFLMTLSSKVPAILKDVIGQYKDQILGSDQKNPLEFYAIHPGGKAILDAIGKGLQIESTQYQESLEVLRDYGNMSSASILFVLQKILAQNKVG
ncbi:type III polyketide synthase, partial [bacterium]|nr:type III polyketide synthase [bacterium]